MRKIAVGATSMERCYLVQFEDNCHQDFSADEVRACLVEPPFAPTGPGPRDVVGYNTVVDAFVGQKNTMGAEVALAKMDRKGVAADAFSYNPRIVAQVKPGDRRSQSTRLRGLSRRAWPSMSSATTP